MANATTWAKQVEAWRASGLTAAEFSDGCDFAAASLRWWSSRLGAMRAEAPRSMRMVRVVRHAAPTPAIDRTSASSSSAILVELAGVLVSTGADRATLTAVFAALDPRTHIGAR